jgi:ABC-type phosphate transport system substrate-binding protein
MKTSIYLSAVAIFTLAVSADGQAPEVKVIANSSVTATAISADELKGIFLLTKASITEGGHVEPVLEKGGATHDAFLKQYVGKSDSALETYYRGLVFTGKASMPKTVGSDAEVMAYVAKTKGAIGYVGADAATEGVKVLDVK